MQKGIFMWQINKQKKNYMKKCAQIRGDSATTVKFDKCD